MIPNQFCKDQAHLNCIYVAFLKLLHCKMQQTSLNFMKSPTQSPQCNVSTSSWFMTDIWISILFDLNCEWNRTLLRAVHTDHRNPPSGTLNPPLNKHLVYDWSDIWISILSDLQCELNSTLHGSLPPPWTPWHLITPNCHATAKTRFLPAGL